MEIGRLQKLVLNSKDKKAYVVQIKKLNQSLKHGLEWKRIDRVIRFEQKYWMKYVMSPKLGIHF